MKPSVIILSAAIFLTGAAMQARGEAPASKLDCSHARLFVNGLVPYCEIRELTVASNGSVEIRNLNGSISVQPWDGADVLVRARVQSAAENEFLAAGLSALVTVETSTGLVVGSGPNTNAHQTWNLNFEIYVPAQSSLSVTNVNGGITVDGLRGSVRFNNTNGGVSITHSAGDVQGRGVNGSVVVKVASWSGQTIDVKTVNGNVELEVPNDCAAHVDLSTVLGNIVTSFAVRSWGPWGLGRHVTFDIGGGGSTIQAATTLGNIQLVVLPAK